MEHLTREFIKAMPATLTGGAWGTELHRRGADIGECLPEWNRTEPDQIFELAREYVQLGSRIILTNTFLADRVSLLRFGLHDDAQPINMRGAALAKQAAGDEAYVIGSIGPAAAANRMQPGALDDREGFLREAAEACAAQAAALDRAGVDAILLETQVDLAEALLTTRAITQATQLPIGVTFSFHAGAAHNRIPSGQGVQELVEAFEEFDLAWIGANCGAGIEAMLPVAREFMAHAKIPVWIRPNAMAAPSDPAHGESDGLGELAFAAAAGELLRMGVKFIGGCCGAGPEHVAALHAMMQGMR